MPLGISCCAIEMMAFAGPRFDVSRFGAEVFRFSPRQSDLLIVAGTVTFKMAKVVRKIYDQMPDPKWVISMGVCASSGGMYRSYSVVQGIDQFVPVDVYVAGCPPRPDSVLKALMEIQKKISLGIPSGQAGADILSEARTRENVSRGIILMNEEMALEAQNIAALRSALGDAIVSVEEVNGQVSVEVKTRSNCRCLQISERGIRI